MRPFLELAFGMLTVAVVAIFTLSVIGLAVGLMVKLGLWAVHL